MANTGFWRVCVALAVLVGGTLPATAQDTGFDCESQRRSNDRTARHCEIREYTVGAASSVLNIDARPNGGISIIGSSRSDVLVRARVTTHAPTEAEAQALARQVQVQAAPGRVSTSGPRSEGNTGWSVSFEVLVPTQTYLSLQSTNGGLSVRDVEGEIDFKTTNGGVRLVNVGGQVKGTTTNGGVQVETNSHSWLGTGLDVETTNGGIEVVVPSGYSGRLEASTSNGRIHSDIPLTVQGRIDNSINVDLGSGGPPMKLKTRNGGVRIVERR